LSVFSEEDMSFIFTSLISDVNHVRLTYYTYVTHEYL